MKKGRIWAAIPGRNPTALVAGSEGEVGEKLEETELYQLVGLDGVGAARFEVAGEDRGRRSVQRRWRSNVGGVARTDRRAPVEVGETLWGLGCGGGGAERGAPR